MHVTCSDSFEIKLYAWFCKLGGPTSDVVSVLIICIIEMECHIPVLTDISWVQSNLANKK